MYKPLPSLDSASVPRILSHCASPDGLTLQPWKCSCHPWNPAYSSFASMPLESSLLCLECPFHLGKSQSSTKFQLTWNLVVMLSLTVPAHLGICSLLGGGVSHGEPCLIQLETDIVHFLHQGPGLATVCFHYLLQYYLASRWSSCFWIEKYKSINSFKTS